ncbi:MAG: TlpA disulfide reductase family protein [Rhodoferax sp.]
MPQGGTVSMSALRGRPLLVNFWATWCAPCVEELPLINDFYRQNKANGWQVVGLAVDKLAPVQAFLQKMPLDFPVGMAGLVGAELSRGMGNLVGGLPFSVVLGSDGMVLQRKMGRLVPDDLANWLRLK